MIMCSDFRPINKEYLSTRQIFLSMVNSSLCCTFWC